MFYNNEKLLKWLTIFVSFAIAYVVVALVYKSKSEKSDDLIDERAMRVKNAQQFIDELRKGVKKSVVQVLLEASDAPNTVVLIRQFHDLSAAQQIIDKLLNKMSPDIRARMPEGLKDIITKMHKSADEDMEATHKDIRVILEDLISRCGIQGVNVEGILQEEEERLQTLPSLDDKVRNLERLAAINLEIKPHLKKVLSHQKKMRSVLTKISPAPASLFFEGKIMIYAGEIGTANEEYFRRLFDEKTDAWTLMQLKTTKRELELLELLSKRKSSKGVTVCGGDHGLTIRLAVAEWNAKNPHDQFHCVVITPLAYAEIKQRNSEKEKQEKNK